MHYDKLVKLHAEMLEQVAWGLECGDRSEAGYLQDWADKLKAAIETEGATEMISRPAMGSRWRHTNGNLYTVTGYSNDKHPSDKYPITVHYVGDNGNAWNRQLSRWHESMTFVPAPTKTGLVTTRQQLSAGRCQAIQFSDELYCNVCALRCDMNEKDPPECGRLKGQPMNMGNR